METIIYAKECWAQAGEVSGVMLERSEEERREPIRRIICAKPNRRPP